MKKLKNQRGESLVESLFSILIVAVSAALLMTMVMVSININSRANAASLTLRQEMTTAENREGGIPGVLSITGDIGLGPVDVTVTDGVGALRAYWRVIGE